MFAHLRLIVGLAATILFAVDHPLHSAEPAPLWSVGVAQVDVTPDEPMYLSGFGNRVIPAEGTAMPLRAKAAALTDPQGSQPVVLVTLDLIDVPIQLRLALEKHLADKHRLGRESLLLNCSHTHCGPELRFAEEDLATLEPPRAAMCRRYNRLLLDKLAKLIDDALAGSAPARVSYGHARCGFAMNRRLKNDGEGEPYLNRPNPEGVVDHDVPVLRIERPDGKLAAVLFGYACHNTTLALKQFHADYAGYAQAALEAAHPGTMALFVMGCGGDQNGYPRMKLEHSEQHGRSLAIAVEAALEATQRPLRGPLRAAYDNVALEFQTPPPAERLRARIATKAEYPRSGYEYHEAWDRRRLTALEQGTLIKSYDFPTQVVRFGDDLLLVALAGETVVDYSLRLKRELAGETPLWVTGYSNDVFAYVPSKRVLLEGGYEAERALSYSSWPVFPAPFQPNVEDKIIGKVRELLAKTQSPPSPPPLKVTTTPVAQLSLADALAGWIALFDGQTNYGWKDASLNTANGASTLRGGTCTTEFADYELRVQAASAGTITLAGQPHSLKPGENTFTSRGKLGPIVLSSQATVSSLLLKPAKLQSLFNGKNLANWDTRSFGHTTKSHATWNVENGAIRARGGVGALEYAPREGTHLFGDCVIQVLVRTRGDGCNGGLFFRNEPGKTMMGYEAQLHHTWYDPAGSKHGYTTGGIDDRQQARAPVAVDHEPFLMTVVAHGPHFATWVNGYQVTDWLDTRPPHTNPRSGKRLEPGTLQLQSHDPETDIEFRQVWVQELR